MHLMRWQQLFPQIFLCSYPFLVHLKFIFVAGASWKVVQSKTKLTLLIYVRSEEDDPLGPTPLNIYLFYYLLRGLFLCFLLLGRIIIKEWGSSPTQRLKFSPPQVYCPNSPNQFKQPLLSEIRPMSHVDYGHSLASNSDRLAEIVLLHNRLFY